jgi:hypothetical protein
MIFGPRPAAPPVVFGPAILQPDLRAVVERSIITSLAGPLAALMVPGPSGYSEDAPCEEFAVRSAAAIERQSPRVRELLGEHEADAQGMSDEDRARTDADGLSWGGTAPTYHVLWLPEQARDALAWHRSALAAIADELYLRIVLTYAEVDAIVRHLPCRCHRWQPVSEEVSA